MSTGGGGSLYFRRAAFWVFLPEALMPLFFLATLFAVRALAGNRSSESRLLITFLIRNVTTLLRSAGSIFPRTFSTFKAFLVIPASSAISFIVYVYSFLALYGCFDPFFGIEASFLVEKVSTKIAQIPCLSIPKMRL